MTLSDLFGIGWILFFFGMFLDDTSMENIGVILAGCAVGFAIARYVLGRLKPARAAQPAGSIAGGRQH